MTEHTRRELRNITRHALHRLATSPDELASEETRETARAALAQLDREAKSDLREPYTYRVTIQPGLHLVVDASHNILVEVRTTDEAELLAAYALSGVMGMINQLELCRTARDAAEQDADAARWAGLFDAGAARRLADAGDRPGEDAASRRAAASQLLGAGLGMSAVAWVIRRAYGHLSATFNVEGTEQLGTVTYDRDTGKYAVRLPVEAELIASITESLAGTGVTSIEFADPNEGQPDSCYEVFAGIRPPRKSGKVRAVVYEREPGTSMEIWHCDHDHAPGVHRCPELTVAQEAGAVACGQAHANQQIASKAWRDLPVVVQPG